MRNLVKEIEYKQIDILIVWELVCNNILTTYFLAYLILVLLQKIVKIA